MKKRILFFLVGGLGFGITMSIASSDILISRQPIGFQFWTTQHTGDGPDPHADFPPVVISTFPQNGSYDVELLISSINVTFSKKMQSDSWSWTTVPNAEFPEFVGEPAYDESGRICSVNVKLKPNTTYAMLLNSEKFGNFKDEKGNSSQPYLFYFSTHDIVDETMNDQTESEE